jgi:hypothetical protein
MSNHPEDVDGFVENLRGVLIETRDLFVLDRHVATGELTREDARSILMSAQSLLSPEGTETIETSVPMSRGMTGA